MASNLFSWVFRPNPSSPTMTAPLRRKLWCAFIDDLQRPFSVSCVIGVDDIDDVRREICTTHSEGYLPRQLALYSPSSRVTDVPTKENLVYLDIRKQILSNFPQSNDPEIDIIVIGPEDTLHSTGTIPHVEPLCHGHS
jgi:hypothetical protein